jgi:prepilin-type N-terminal cleavage/methylation domain-containing protein
MAYRWKRRLSACGRRGFTLIEILLVLSIVAAISSIALMSFGALVSSRHIDHSADTLLIAVDTGRNKALRTGQAQLFRFMIGKNVYTVQPWMGTMDEINSGPGSTVMSATSGQVYSTFESNGMSSSVGVENSGQKEETIDEDVYFESVNTFNDTRSQMIELESGGGATVDGSWSAPILFYPGGGATSAEIIISDKKGRRRALQIRGLTGQSKVILLPGGAPST